MIKPKTQAEQIEWCGKQIKIAKIKAPEKYNEIEKLIKLEMKKSNVGELEAAINLCMNFKNDSVLHLWFLGVSALLIENK